MHMIYDRRHVRQLTHEITQKILDSDATLHIKNTLYMEKRTLSWFLAKAKHRVRLPVHRSSTIGTFDQDHCLSRQLLDLPSVASFESGSHSPIPRNFRDVLFCKNLPLFTEALPNWCPPQNQLGSSWYVSLVLLAFSLDSP